MSSAYTDDDIVKLHKILSMSIELGVTRDERIAQLEQVVLGLVRSLKQKVQPHEEAATVVVWLN